MSTTVTKRKQAENQQTELFARLKKNSQSKITGSFRVAAPT